MNADYTIYDISDFTLDPVKLSTVLFLLTIERSDEHRCIESEPGQSLVEKSGSIAESDFVILQSIVERAEPESYKAAAKTLQAHWEKASYRKVLVPFILTAIASGRLTVSGNHLLRFISRMAFGSEAPLISVFSEMTDRSLPAPGDPSSLDWWGKTDPHRDQDHTTVSVTMNPQRACLILGLCGEKTQSSVKQAYTLMIGDLYADSFVAQEEETFKEIALTFREVHLAYEYLAS